MSEDLIKRLRGVHHAMLDWAEDFRRVGSVDGEMSERSRAELLKAAASRIEALECRERVLREALQHLAADVEAAHVSGSLTSPPPTEHEIANLRRARAALAGDAP